jgi:hypothetical protein
VKPIEALRITVLAVTGAKNDSTLLRGHKRRELRKSRDAQTMQSAF